MTKTVIIHEDEWDLHDDVELAIRSGPDLDGDRQLILWGSLLEAAETVARNRGLSLEAYMVDLVGRALSEEE